jgi:hypothetical protein
MEAIVIRRGLSSVPSVDVDAWKSLFIECFKKTPQEAASIFRKYELQPEQVWMCMAFKDGQLVACYSGVALAFGSEQVLLATDTMSNGQIAGATVKMAQMLYPALAAAGVSAVCGYPNGNIIKLRERKLGWKMVGQMHLYIGVPVLWRLGQRSPASRALWNLRRPDTGFFAPTRLPLTLLGRDGPYRGGVLIATLASRAPGPGFIRVPSSLVAPKNFGFVLTSEGTSQTAWQLEQAARDLDLNTIDVP